MDAGGTAHSKDAVGADLGGPSMDVAPGAGGVGGKPVVVLEAGSPGAGTARRPPRVGREVGVTHVRFQHLIYHQSLLV